MKGAKAAGMDHDTMNHNAELDTAVRVHIYRQIIESGEPPRAHQTAAALGRSDEEAEGAYRRLHEGHVLVLEPDSADIRMAMPFSTVPTAYRVTVDDRSWWST